MCLSKNVNDSDAVDCAVPRVHGACGWGQTWYIEGTAVVGGERGWSSSGSGAPYKAQN